MESGRLIALAQSGGKRISALSDLPTFKESEIDVQFALWTARFIRAGTPQMEVARLQRALHIAIEDKTFKVGLAGAQSTLAYVEGEAFRTLWRAEVVKLQATVRHIGKVEEAR